MHRCHVSHAMTQHHQTQPSRVPGRTLFPPSLQLPSRHSLPTAGIPTCPIPSSRLISLLRPTPRWSGRTNRQSNEPRCQQDGAAGSGHGATQGGFPRPPCEQSSPGATAKTGSCSAAEPECKQARLGTETGQTERLQAGCTPAAQKGRAGRCSRRRREGGKAKE